MCHASLNQFTNARIILLLRHFHGFYAVLNDEEAITSMLSMSIQQCFAKAFESVK